MKHYKLIGILGHSLFLNGYQLVVKNLIEGSLSSDHAYYLFSDKHINHNNYHIS